MTALSQFRVLDLSRGVAGPYCTRFFAGFGAEVIKIERPGEGDSSRAAGPFPNDQPNRETSGLFMHLNGGKRSVTLDLSTATGAKLLREIAAECDLVVSSFRPASLERLGLWPADWVAEFPRQVFLALTNFGLTGPYRDYPAADVTLEALGGLLYITGEGDRPPLRDPGNQAQYIAGARAFGLALIALWERNRSGQGQVIDLSIAASVTHMLENTMMRWSYARQVRKRSAVFRSSVYPCKDGFIGVFDGAGRQWRQIADLMEEPRLLDERYAGGLQAGDHADEIDALMLPWLIQRDREEIFRLAQARRMPFGPVRTTKELAESEQLNGRGFFVTPEHPVAGAMKAPGAPFRLPASPWAPAPAPLLGEHTAEVLGRLGYGPADLVVLRERGVI
jgi:crotonobetainyl-CoA:carnitine CoA-transferase CaiB-like acyl-CoA transferase